VTPIFCKPTVRLVGVSHALVEILAALRETVDACPHLVPGEVVLTSIHDSVHAPKSRHYTDEAVDLRSKSFSPLSKRKFREVLQTRLGPRFTVLLEGVGTPNEHFHVQVKKGTRYP
jgi:hypothetical protein